MTKNISTAVKPVASDVNRAVVPTAIDMTRMFRSLERDYGYHIQASYNGFTVGKKGERPVYAEGVYRPVMARGKAQCAEYRLRMLKFFLWAVERAPTPEIREYEGWIRAKF